MTGWDQACLSAQRLHSPGTNHPGSTVKSAPFRLVSSVEVTHGRLHSDTRTTCTSEWRPKCFHVLLSSSCLEHCGVCLRQAWDVTAVCSWGEFKRFMFEFREAGDWCWCWYSCWYWCWYCSLSFVLQAFRLVFHRMGWHCIRGRCANWNMTYCNISSSSNRM